MPFPDYTRVLYANNPLAEVVCQIRFPMILKIAELPTAFQEAIRTQYPILRQKPAVDLPAEMPTEMKLAIAAKAGNIYQFLSRDGIWTVSLFPDFLALSCAQYERWETFNAAFSGPLEALRRIFAPSFCTRVGLRYQNTINRDRLSIADTPWSALLNSHVCGELGDPDISQQIEQSKREVVIKLDDAVKVHLTHGLVENENSYVIDADFFTDVEVELDHVISKLSSFNRASGRLFRWAITPKLHEAMGPRPNGTS